MNPYSSTFTDTLLRPSIRHTVIVSKEGKDSRVSQGWDPLSPSSRRSDVEQEVFRYESRAAIEYLFDAQEPQTQVPVVKEEPLVQPTDLIFG